MKKLKSKPKAKSKKATARPPHEELEPPAELLLSRTGVIPHLYSIGDRVHHPMFGDGKVESIREDKLTIAFSHGLRKEIRADFVTNKK
jgi:Protein of unknown function (DUF3553)